jgi:outer membrane immunogenic protein
MKKLLFGSAMLAALAMGGPAMAADLPAAPVYKAPVIAPAPWYDWTGFYIGLNGGYSWGRSATDFSVAGVPLVSATTSMNGWVGGGQAGYNWQFNRNWIVGVEADLQATGQKGSLTFAGAPACFTAVVAAITTCTTTTGTFEQKLPWFGTARARLGFEPADHWMLYVTGGLAFGEVDTNAGVTTTTTINGVTVASTSAAASSNVTRAGWTVGGGAEWVISGPWTAKLEYLRVDLGTITNTFVGAGAIPTVATNSRVTDNIVRVGVNYRFGGPVVARY